MSTYRVIPGSASSPVVLHVPHGSVHIPEPVRARILLDDDALATELGHMTDAHTGTIAAHAAETAGRRPWIFENLASRLVVDPERFPDEREEMRAAGMGAVYVLTSHGAALRHPDAAEEQHLLERYFHPYAQAIADLVDARLAAAGRAVVLDVHSYPSKPLPYELHADGARPAVCLGTDAFHTPDWLLDAAHDAFGGFGGIGLNTPFAGCYVPLRHYGARRDVSGLMLELRRDLYLTEAGEPPTGGLGPPAAALARLVDLCDRSDP